MSNLMFHSIMCGRFSLTAAPEWVAEHFGLTEVPALQPRYNIAPTQDVAVVRVGEGGRRLDEIRWGLLPASMPDPGAPLINARSETVMERPSFRPAFLARRCLVPADGFFEWKRVNGRKQPIYFMLRDHEPFAFAGLWESWTASDGNPVESCTILTTEPNPLVRPVHDRMPVILAAAGHEPWLASESDPEKDLLPLLRPYPPDAMQAYPVSPVVNSAEPDSPECIEPQGYEEQGDLFGS
jgi:putative SOS response-associated peptidase YedK